MSAKELEVKEKKELQAKGETTYSVKAFQPDVDIYETEKEIYLYADMPGVRKEDIDMTVEDKSLFIRGRVRPQEYAGLRPMYIEYNLGHYEREFQLTEQVDRNNIEATVENGVLGLKLKKAEKAQPRKIEIH